MKVHYINILLFAFPLNILVSSPPKNPSITPKIPTNRSLCECELYAPANYDNDPHMKKVMQQFEDRTSQRFHEYNDRMIEKQKQCKDKCDKEIQKIILKDKLEKELMDKFATLQTDIKSDAIPTCICEKSVADKMEKNCLKCGYGLGTVAPTVGLIGSVAVNVWKTAKIAAATQEAIAKGAIAGEAARIPAAIKAVIEGIKSTFGVSAIDVQQMGLIFDGTNYMKVSVISEKIYSHYSTTCIFHKVQDRILLGSNPNHPMCTLVWRKTQGTLVSESAKADIAEKLNGIVAGAEQAAKAEATQMASAEEAAVLDTSKKAIEAASIEMYPGIGYSILAILIIVLIMVIIYKILRYRRKKKMKKKLQYIKLLEE
ncbi:rifin PIR protein, putative [Plasmodium reichenowi]|uniref:Rifin PIR protein, putative n=1 Tax=Plasmodium reichenowi TaxID=5854 RepID=A0A2P9D1P6_PLARE|nr:rifin PIR protein, putative [Plasmodium reichenowi]